MKKTFIFIASLMLWGTLNAIPVRIIFEYSGGDFSPLIPQLPKSPVDLPNVMQDGGVITFKASHDDYTLSLIDEDGDVVFQTVVPSAMTTVALPSSLSGNYELRLYPDGSSIYFYGYVVF